MYKIFEVTYNDGGWHSGDLPHFFYIARSKDEVIENSKKYQEYLGWQKNRGGSLWITEVSGLQHNFHFENLADFEITVSVRRKN